MTRAEAEYARALAERVEGRPRDRLKEMVDAIMDDMSDIPANIAAESAAYELGYYFKRTVSLGRPACDVALEGQKPPPWWKRILCLGMTMWESGAWVTVSDDYRREDSHFKHWPLSHEIVYR